MRLSRRRQATWSIRPLPLLVAYLALVAASALPHCHQAAAAGHSGTPAPQIVTELQPHHGSDSCPVCRWQSAANSHAQPGVAPDHLYRYTAAQPAAFADSLLPSFLAPCQNRAPPSPA